MRRDVSSVRSRGGARRLPVAALGLLLVVVQGASLGHLLLERHEVCPEHGELIHAGVAGAGHGWGAGQPAGAESERAVRAPHASEAIAHSDDHCTALATRRELALLPASGGELSVGPSGEVGTLPPRANTQHESRARYDVAPKQSPPV